MASARRSEWRSRALGGGRNGRLRQLGAFGGFFATWKATADARNLTTIEPVTLDRWVAFRRHLEPLIRFGMTTAHDALLTGALPADLASLSFDKGIAQASIAERADSQAMVAFDVAAHNRTIDRFTSSTTAIRDALPPVDPPPRLSPTGGSTLRMKAE